MYIDSLRLSQFRNYESLDLTLSPGINVFFGDNAQGKTNILEAVYLCGTSRSHRSGKDKDMIRFGQAEAHIRMMVKKKDAAWKLDMHLRKDKAKGIAVNGLPIRKAGELMGIVTIIFFSPEDLNIIKNGPSERRKFLDMELCQLDPLYLSDLMMYSKVLNQRNHLLKDISLQSSLMSTLDIWDDQLISYGKRIIEKRTAFIKEMNELILDIHSKLTGDVEELQLCYEPDTTEAEFDNKIKQARDRDLKMKISSVGPHRDDLKVSANGTDLRKFGSQGQQRTAALSLKLSEIYMVKKKIKECPVLLLDDVLSELDRNRQNYLLEGIHDIQTLITCTGLEDFMQRKLQVDRFFQVKAGQIQ